MGAEGARRAKRWLECTTRANVRWVNPSPVAVRKLTFQWVDGRSYSFDLGGVFLGDDLEGQEFLAESKYYKSAQDQGTHYRRFLAGCYRAYVLRPERCDNFLWISWSPFNVNSWTEIRDAAYVRKAVLEHWEKAVGGDAETAQGPVVDEVCKVIADRLWMILLTKRQESLVPSLEHLSIIRAHDTRKADW